MLTIDGTKKRSSLAAGCRVGEADEKLEAGHKSEKDVEEERYVDMGSSQEKTCVRAQLMSI